MYGHNFKFYLMVLVDWSLLAILSKQEGHSCCKNIPFNDMRRFSTHQRCDKNCKEIGLVFCDCSQHLFCLFFGSSWHYEVGFLATRICFGVCFSVAGGGVSVRNCGMLVDTLHYSETG